MKESKQTTAALPAELREIVRWLSTLLGETIKSEAGEKTYQLVEDTRREMAELRSLEDRERASRSSSKLNDCYKKFQGCSRKEQLDLARSFTLLLEVTNCCEAAYRSMRLGKIRPLPDGAPRADAIVYVLTAHPTEARTPESMVVFHQIQRTLISYLHNRISRTEAENNLRHELSLAWRISLVRERAPKVIDEAEHVYSTLCHPYTLSALLSTSNNTIPVYIRSWVGGDKDGHPGVDEKILLQSLQLSRRYLLQYARSQIKQVHTSLAQLPGRSLILSDLRTLERSLRQLNLLRAKDAIKVKSARAALLKTVGSYQKEYGSLHPSLRRLRQLFHVFPALVVPLELRESSDIISAPMPKPPAIARMLETIAKISSGGDALWYARGLIISMTYSIQHLRAAEQLVRKYLGKCRLPVIPLFEQIDALTQAPKICREILQDPRLSQALKSQWGNYLEIMVGYSDSAKEAGVFPSRLAIAGAMHELEKICAKEGVQSLFFQGSGGSVARGGGLVQDQTAWLPRTALKKYKVTIQGEMVERSFASPEITRGQIEKISQSLSLALQNKSIAPHQAEVSAFAQKISQAYSQSIIDPSFLHMVEAATPYSQLNLLRMGSRPTRRSTQLSVASLRAIPWVLCWTQTRIFFPTWWGVGSAWQNSSKEEKEKLKSALLAEPVFHSYLHALAFTLAKLEPEVWDFYLDHSKLTKEEIDSFKKRFRHELNLTLECVRSLQGQQDLLWFRPWLGESIRMRSPLIHPLNVLQQIAKENKIDPLFRLTVAGISAGLLNTG